MDNKNMNIYKINIHYLTNIYNKLFIKLIFIVYNAFIYV